MAKRNLLRFIKKIQKDSAESEEYNTGLVGEHLIVSAYKQMSINELEQYRIIINGLIKKKKILKRVQEKNKQDGERHERDNVPDSFAGTDDTITADSKTAEQDAFNSINVDN